MGCRWCWRRGQLARGLFVSVRRFGVAGSTAARGKLLVAGVGLWTVVSGLVAPTGGGASFGSHADRSTHGVGSVGRISSSKQLLATAERLVTAIAAVAVV